MKKIKNIKIGAVIKAVVKEQGRTNVWLARQIGRTPNHIYKIYNSSSIDTDMLILISQLLGHNFFEDFIIKEDDLQSSDDTIS